MPWVPALAGAIACVSSLAFTHAAAQAAEPAPGQRVVIRAERWPGLPVAGRLEADGEIALTELSARTLEAPGNASLTAVLAALPSVGENFAAVGYYENFTIRGFTLDMGSAFRVNGMVVPGEWQFPLEGTTRLQVAAGVAGSRGGWVGGGGSINQVTPRGSEPLRARYEADDHGGMLLAVQGGKESPSWAWHATASAARPRPPYPAADGHRQFLAVALDAAPNDRVRLFVDAALQHRSQPVVPGFQLLGGTTPPELSLRGVNLNAQPWSRPVRNEGVLGMLRVEGFEGAEGVEGDGLRWEAGWSHALARIDDNLATPFGCNSAPFEFFCSNGDYVLYDYHASERRSTTHARASAAFRLRALGATHELQAGVERIDRQVVQRDVYSSTLYDEAGLALSGNIFRPDVVLPQPGAQGVDRPTTRRIQTALMLGHSVAAGPWRSALGVRWVDIEAPGVMSSRRYVLPRWTLSWHAHAMHELFVGAARGLEFGSEAPATAANAGAVLAPRVTHQVEAGWKGGAEGTFRYGVTAYRAARPWEFVEPVGSSWAGRGAWVQRGRQRHTGLEATFTASLAGEGRLEGRVTRIHALGTGSELPGRDGKQLQNIPRTGLHLRLEQDLGWQPGLSGNVALTARSSKSASADGAAHVGGYGVLDIGLSGKLPSSGPQLRFDLGVRNATDRRYWRDAGQAYSADLLFPGVARTVFLAIHLGTPN